MKMVSFECGILGEKNDKDGHRVRCYNSFTFKEEVIMIKMNLELLSKVESLERLLARLPEFHANRSYVEMQLHRAAAGVRGEARIRRKFTEFYVEEAFDVIWNISLNLGQWRVQMDGLLLTEKCAVVIESKNISGKLHYNQLTEEFFRLNSENEKTVMENPAIQLKKNTRFLTQ